MTYIVQAGDTLFLLARKHGVTLDALIAANPQIANPNLIMPGQVITIPAPGPAAPSFPAGAGKEAPGTPGEKPLRFAGITENGREAQNAVQVPTQPKFTVRFDKNVVNSAVWENNQKSFRLVSARGEDIPVNVTRIEDTVDFSQRRNIFITPVNPLAPGAAYTLTILPRLMSKTGETLDRTVTITFRTAG